MDTMALDIHDSVAVLAFNRPQALNAITAEMIDDINSALNQILAPKSGVRCLLLTGRGRGFSSGADLMTGITGIDGDPALLDAGLVLQTHFNPLVERLMAMPIPFVTAINGPAAGAGCSLAILGDVVIAARSAYFLQAFVNIGLVPDVASSWLLPRLIGKARAQAMMMLGERVPAEKALEWGMIYDVADDDQLMDRAMALAKKLSHGPTRSIALMRHSIHYGLQHSLTEQLQRERDDQRTAGRSTDFAEGVSAFLAKRPAKFTGA
jgi:2-(1,2-epoxy-1,2-dihydrophenyl)acetyl-CoA isomerase